MLGVIGNVGFFENEIFKKAAISEIKTRYGPSEILEIQNIVFLPRHGIKKYIPAHMIDHKANLMALKDKGIERIIGMNSVGSLKLEIPPASILIPSDYINFVKIPTYHDNEMVNIIPSLDEGLRNNLISQAKKMNLDVIEQGIYIQTQGPRLETKAEISMLKNFADVIGMTMASEATLAQELDLPYASICTVDNYANGIVEEILTTDSIMASTRANSGKIRDIIFKVAGEL